MTLIERIEGAFPRTRHSWWRLRLALADYALARLERKLWLARVRYRTIMHQEPAAALRSIGDTHDD